MVIGGDGEQQKKRIDEQVALLGEALTEEQTERYREHLEAKQQGMFGNMILEVQEGEIDAPTPEAIVE